MARKEMYTLKVDGRVVWTSNRLPYMRTISALVGALKQVADLAGFEIVGRVVLMDKDSGRIFR